MTKKEYILKILEKLRQKWEFGQILYEIILRFEDNELTDKLYIIFSENIDNLNSKILEKIYIQTKNKIQIIREKENLMRENENIDAILDNL